MFSDSIQKQMVKENPIQSTRRRRIKILQKLVWLVGV